MQNVAALSNAAMRNTQSPQARAAASQQQQRSLDQAQAQAATASNQIIQSRQGHHGQNRTSVREATPPLRPSMASTSQPHPSPRAATMTPKHPTPVEAAASQNHLEDVPALPPSRSPDSATYNAASS